MSTTIKKSIATTTSFNACKRDAVIIDATGVVVGRLAAYIATLLRGKHKTIFTPHAELGDFVIVINADKIKFTADKDNVKHYWYHTGFPGGIKFKTPRMLRMRGQSSEIIMKAVKGMLPKNVLGRNVLKNLRVCNGETHDYESMKPRVVNFVQMNRKNVA